MATFARVRRLAHSSIRSALSRAGAEHQLRVVERAGEQLAGSNLDVPLPTAELHRLLTASVINAVGSGSGFRTEIATPATPSSTSTRRTERRSLRATSGSSAAAPGLATTGYASRFDNGRVFTNFDDLADEALAWLQERNIVTIRGRIIATSKYAPTSAITTTLIETSEGRVNVWDRRDGRPMRSARSALLLNDGFVDWPEDVIDPTLNERASNPSRSRRPSSTTSSNSPGLPCCAALGRRRPADRRAKDPGRDRDLLDDIVASSLVDATTAEMLLKEYGIRSGTSAEREAVVFALAVGNGFSFAGSVRYHHDGLRRWLGTVVSQRDHLRDDSRHDRRPRRRGRQCAPERGGKPVAGCAGSTGSALGCSRSPRLHHRLAGWYDAPTVSDLRCDAGGRSVKVHRPGRRPRGDRSRSDPTSSQSAAAGNARCHYRASLWPRSR